MTNPDRPVLRQQVGDYAGWVAANQSIAAGPLAELFALDPAEWAVVGVELTSQDSSPAAWALCVRQVEVQRAGDLRALAARQACGMHVYRVALPGHRNLQEIVDVCFRRFEARLMAAEIANVELVVD